MAAIQVVAGRSIDAPADAVYECLADFRRHAHFLPPAFSAFEIESGGKGAGTLVRFTVTAGGRRRDYRMQVSEPEPWVLVESDTGSSLVTTFRVMPCGARAQVTIMTTWRGSGGIGGIFERMFAPRVMRAIYRDELERLNAYLCEDGEAITAT